MKVRMDKKDHDRLAQLDKMLAEIGRDEGKENFKLTAALQEENRATTKKFSTEAKQVTESYKRKAEKIAKEYKRQLKKLEDKHNTLQDENMAERRGTLDQLEIGMKRKMEEAAERHAASIKDLTDKAYKERQPILAEIHKIKAKYAPKPKPEIKITPPKPAVEAPKVEAPKAEAVQE